MGMMSDNQFEVKYPKHWVLQHLQGLTQRLHATHAHFHDPQLGLEVLWSSRRHRKGRRVEVVGEPGGPRVRRHWPTLWGFEFGNISWWVAQFFTWGSAVWCVNGWYSLFPLSNETINGNIVGWTALVGGTLFEAGAYCMVVEALNRGHTVRFGYEVTKTLRASVHHLEADVRYLEETAGSGTYSLFESAEGGHESSHHASANGAGPDSNGQPRADRDDARRNRSAERVAGREWMWWGYRWRDLGYLASFITFIGATTFWVSTITGVPGVLPIEATHIAEWDILFWLPQVLGSCCFITASILFMLEVQQSWWRIEPFDLGWHVGFWNFVGGVGFWLCGFFGFFAYPAGKYQRWGTNCSTFWGAWAFLLGSYIQLVEMLN